MSVEENKALMRHLFDESNKGKTAAMAVIDELYDTNIVMHCPRGKDICGLKDYKQANEESFDEIPDAYSIIDDMIAEGDKVAVRLTMTGTYVGKMGDTVSTSKKVTVSMIMIDRVAGGRFVEEWVRYDTLGFMEQLGLVPTPKIEK
jgi:predicted ester cyclase